jgi:lysyl-tRNA synthetase class 2
MTGPFQKPDASQSAGQSTGAKSAHNVTLRRQYLENFWQPYPAARPTIRPVDEFLLSNTESGKTSAWVAGRLLQDKKTSSWRLAAGGEQICVLLTPQSQWSVAAAATAAWPTPENVLLPGDLVSLELVPGNEETDGDFREWSAQRVELLAPCLAPYGPSAGFSVERSQQWASFLDCIRGFFKQNRFIEAWTPTLVPSPGTEPFLDPFLTHWQPSAGAAATALYLPTSPEFHLKKMLAQGWTRIFEFKTCFRNAEIGPHHQPEFMMLEWYRAYAGLDQIVMDCQQLLATLAKHFTLPIPPLRQVTMSELFAEKISGFTLKPSTTLADLCELADRLHIRHSAIGAHAGAGGDTNSDDWDVVFFRIFLEKIEPGLGAEGPLLVRGYPPSQAALSRLDPAGFADRFELYWKGLEIANAFHELNDPAENVIRMKRDGLKKEQIGKPAVPVDAELITALESGFPPSGGIALGLDRLFMALFGVEKISDARAFAMRDPLLLT